MKYSVIFFLFLLTSINLQAQSAEDNSISIGDVIEIKSNILDETREIYVYEPEGFWGMDEDMTRLPVIIVLDGESQFLHTATTVDFLSSAPLGSDFMPRSLVIGIPNTNRTRDLTPTKGIIARDTATLEITGGGSDFLRFITEELLPYIESNYSASSHRTIIGHSLGGLLTLEALLRKREYFDNYISIDPALGFADETYMEEVIDTLDQVDLSGENVFLTVGNTRPTFMKEEEILQDTSDVMRLVDVPNRKFLNIAESNQWKINLTTAYYPGENHFAVPHRSTYDGLKSLYDYYTFSEVMNYYHPDYRDRVDLVERIEAHYEMISSRMGQEVLPMVGYINSFAFGIAPSGREDLAIALFEYNIALHPDNPIVYNNLGYFYNINGYPHKALEVYQESIKLDRDPNLLLIIEELEKELIDQKR